MATVEQQMQVLRNVMTEAATPGERVLSATRLFHLAVDLTSLMQADTPAWEDATQYESACGANLLETLNEYIDARVAAAVAKQKK
jgi:hypothetical protein